MALIDELKVMRDTAIQARDLQFQKANEFSRAATTWHERVEDLDKAISALEPEALLDDQQDKYPQSEGWMRYDPAHIRPAPSAIVEVVYSDDDGTISTEAKYVDWNVNRLTHWRFEDWKQSVPDKSNSHQSPDVGAVEIPEGGMGPCLTWHSSGIYENGKRIFPPEQTPSIPVDNAGEEGKFIDTTGFEIWRGTHSRGPIYDVGHSELIELIFRSGARDQGRRDDFDWTPVGSQSDIIAYRVITTPERTPDQEPVETVARTEQPKHMGELPDHGVGEATFPEGETRVMSAEEQRIMHVALRKSARVIDPQTNESQSLTREAQGIYAPGSSMFVPKEEPPKQKHGGLFGGINLFGGKKVEA